MATGLLEKYGPIRATHINVLRLRWIQPMVRLRARSITEHQDTSQFAGNSVRCNSLSIGCFRVMRTHLETRFCYKVFFMPVVSNKWRKPFIEKERLSCTRVKAYLTFVTKKDYLSICTPTLWKKSKCSLWSDVMHERFIAGIHSISPDRACHNILLREAKLARMRFLPTMLVWGNFVLGNVTNIQGLFGPVLFRSSQPWT